MFLEEYFDQNEKEKKLKEMGTLFNLKKQILKLKFNFG